MWIIIWLVLCPFYVLRAVAFDDACAMAFNLTSSMTVSLYDLKCDLCYDLHMWHVLWLVMWSMQWPLVWPVQRPLVWPLLWCDLCFDLWCDLSYDIWWDLSFDLQYGVNFDLWCGMCSLETSLFIFFKTILRHILNIKYIKYKSRNQTNCGTRYSFVKCTPLNKKFQTTSMFTMILLWPWPYWPGWPCQNHGISQILFFFLSVGEDIWRTGSMCCCRSYLCGVHANHWSHLLLLSLLLS